MDNKNFKWNSTLTFAANHDEFTDLIDGNDLIAAESSITSRLLIGRRLSSYHYFINQGIWQENEAEEALSLIHIYVNNTRSTYLNVSGYLELSPIKDFTFTSRINGTLSDSCLLYTSGEESDFGFRS